MAKTQQRLIAFGIKRIIHFDPFQADLSNVLSDDSASLDVNIYLLRRVQP